MENAAGLTRANFADKTVMKTGLNPLQKKNCRCRVRKTD